MSAWILSEPIISVVKIRWQTVKNVHGRVGGTNNRKITVARRLSILIQIFRCLFANVLEFGANSKLQFPMIQSCSLFVQSKVMQFLKRKQNPSSRSDKIQAFVRSDKLRPSFPRVRIVQFSCVGWEQIALGFDVRLGRACRYLSVFNNRGV